jgi:hypothetical protein
MKILTIDAWGGDKLDNNTNNNLLADYLILAQ